MLRISSKLVEGNAFSLSKLVLPVKLAPGENIQSDLRQQ